MIAMENPAAAFPFDVRHRRIVTYRTDSPSDFARLQDQIREALQAARARNAQLASFRDSPLAPTGGLADYEAAALAILMTGSEKGVGLTMRELTERMGRAGFTDVAAALGLRRLTRRGYVTEIIVEQDHYDSYVAYSSTESGEAWLMDNESQLQLRQPPPLRRRHSRNDDDDDLPF
jgi:hypothetical protein